MDIDKATNDLLDDILGVQCDSVDEKRGNTAEAKSMAISSKFVSKMVLPGDDITEIVSACGDNISIGFGISQKGDKVISTVCGNLRFRRPNIFWVDHRNHKYIAMKEDIIVATVKNSFSEGYILDFNGTSTGTLSHVAFDGATKRSRPFLENGAVIYCRVEKTVRDLDTEFTCKAPSGIPIKDWASGEAFFGELKGGYLFKVSLRLSEKLLQPNCIVLECLAKQLAFEIAVGMNGVVWIDAKKPIEIVLISNSIKQTEKMRDSEVPDFIGKILKLSKANLSKPA